LGGGFGGERAEIGKKENSNEKGRKKVESLSRRQKNWRQSLTGLEGRGACPEARGKPKFDPRGID